MGKGQSGKCQLTGDHGRFVKCHILPEALTRHEEPGQPIYQAGERRRPVKRMTSWYDPKLVTLTGERILARYDDWAITFLRRNKLVWSGWSGQKLPAERAIDLGGAWQAIIVESDDWPRLRLFLLSVLWRAAASKLPEFSEIVLPSADLERLRHMVAAGETDPLDFFPATLVQLTTKGPRHNHSPISGVKSLGPYGPVLDRKIRFFRFFIEGLVIHFDLDSSGAGDIALLGPMAVGAGRSLVILGHPFEGSFQASNLGMMLVEAWEDWPHMRPQIARAIQPMKDRPAR